MDKKFNTLRTLWRDDDDHHHHHTLTINDDTGPAAAAVEMCRNFSPIQFYA